MVNMPEAEKILLKNIILDIRVFKIRWSVVGKSRSYAELKTMTFWFKWHTRIYDLKQISLDLRHFRIRIAEVS